MIVGEVVRMPSGRRWRVHCTNGAGVLGLVPVGLWHRLYWWIRTLR